jgi:hypothetical protein
MKRIILIILVTLMNFTLAFGQQNSFYKHPKVIEVEMEMTKEANSFLQQRLPNEQIYVQVDIEPLRRNNGEKSEQLPYFYSEDEVSDEWDALDTPTVILLSRIKKANLRVEIPTTVSELEASDLKEKLYQHLKLIPGRDLINIERKNPATRVNNSSKDLTTYYFIAGMTLVVLAGLFVIIRFGIKGNVTSGTSQSTATNAPSAAPAMPMRSNSGSKTNISSTGLINSKVNGDINFKDSIRAADMLKEKLHGVVNSPIFPLLSDMLILEELATKSLSSFGAFVFEMPRKHQQKIFFRSRSDKWFQGYIEAASVDMECFLAVEKMLRNRTAQGSEKWEELLVQVWRLGEESHMFLKQIPSDDAFAILAHLPKSISVPTAKKAFPGGWAKILEIREVHPIEDEMKVEDYVERTLQLKPYFSFKSIDDYKKDIELVEYLRVASVKDEEEIYESLSFDSHVWNIRPPFYKVLRAEDESFKEFFTQYDLNDWAISVINSPREMSQVIYRVLDDKKKYIFRNLLKALDEQGFEAKDQIAIREEMAKNFRQFVEIKKQNAKINKTESENVESEQNNEAEAA